MMNAVQVEREQTTCPVWSLIIIAFHGELYK